MKISHDKEADAGDNETPEFDAGIGGNAAREVVGDLAVEKDDRAAAGEDN